MMSQKIYRSNKVSIAKSQIHKKKTIKHSSQKKCKTIMSNNNKINNKIILKLEIRPYK